MRPLGQMCVCVCMCVSPISWPIYIVLKAEFNFLLCVISDLIGLILCRVISVAVTESQRHTDKRKWTREESNTIDGVGVGGSKDKGEEIKAAGEKRQMNRGGLYKKNIQSSLGVMSKNLAETAIRPRRRLHLVLI